MITMASLFFLLLVITRFSSALENWGYMALGTSIMCAIILTIVFNQRFAIGMSLFYSVFACFSVGVSTNLELFLTIMAGVLTCCFALGEIRTRLKLFYVSIVACVVVFAASLAFRAEFPMQLLNMRDG